MIAPHWVRIALFISAVVLQGLVGPSWAGADDNRWGFGSDLGFTSGTVNGTVFTLGFNLDYHIDRNFSVGPMMQISPMGDLFQIAFAGMGRITCASQTGSIWSPSSASD